MNRRNTLKTCAAMAVLPWAAPRVFAQTHGVKRVGVLTTLPRDHPIAAPYWKRGLKRLKQLGWEEGRNLVFEFRVGADPDTLREGAEQLVAAQVDLIYADGDGPAAFAFRATKTIPIVMHGGAAVELGYAQSLARPGGNVTGVVYQALDQSGKSLSQLLAMRPGLAIIGMPLTRGRSLGDAWYESWNAVAAPRGIRIAVLPALRTLADVAPMLDAATREQIHALVTPNLPFLKGEGWRQIGAWAAQHRVVTYGSILARGEAVIAFGANLDEPFRLTTMQLDRVLRGANPAEVPIMQPTMFDVVVNRKLARDVGWPAPAAVLSQATEVLD